MEIFLHIPKTAGSTLNHVLRNQFRAPGSIYHINHWNPQQAARRYHTICPKRQLATRLFKGHVHFGVHQYLNEPCSYFTVLRDPVERVISHYYYVLGTPGHAEHASLMSRKMTLPDYVASGIYPELDNGQTRMLAGRDGLPEQTAFGQCDADLLALAEKNLTEHFGVVGIQEEFDSTLLLLQDTYQWKTPYYVTENVTRKRPRREDISAETLNVIRTFNRIDAMLYARVKQRFHDRLAGQGVAFAAELDRFQRANKRYEQVHQIVATSVMSRTRRLKRLIRLR